MQMVYFVLLLLGLVCFLIEAFRVVESRVNLLALGLALWIAVSFLQTLQRL